MIDNSKIKINFNINAETKEKLDDFKRRNRINMSFTIDKLLNFNKEGMKEYINLTKKFTQEDNITIEDSDFFITTNPETIEKIKNPSSGADTELMKTLTSIASITNNEKALEEDIKILMNKYLSSNLDTKVETQPQTEDESDEELLSKLQSFNSKEESKKVSTTLSQKS